MVIADFRRPGRIHEGGDPTDRTVRAFVVTINLDFFTTRAKEEIPAHRLLPLVRKHYAAHREAMAASHGLYNVLSPVLLQSILPTGADGPPDPVERLLGRIEALAREAAAEGMEPGTGVAAGSVALGTRRPFPSRGCVAVGAPVARSRGLAALQARHGMAVLLDAAAGNMLRGARIVDLYRTPGETGLSVLYGYQREFMSELSGPVRESFHAAFRRGLEALYADGEGDRGRAPFLECLRIEPRDTVAAELLRLAEGAIRAAPIALRSE